MLVPVFSLPSGISCLSECGQFFYVVYVRKRPIRPLAEALNEEERRR